MFNSNNESKHFITRHPLIYMATTHSFNTFTTHSFNTLPPTHSSHLSPIYSIYLPLTRSIHLPPTCSIIYHPFILYIYNLLITRSPPTHSHSYIYSFTYLPVNMFIAHSFIIRNNPNIQWLYVQRKDSLLNTFAVQIAIKHSIHQ